MSDAADHTRLSIFRRALPLSGAARTRFLDEVCGADATLRSGVEAMLTAHERGGDESAISRATTRGAAAAATVVAASADELPDAAGVTLDKYTLVRKLGEGGFGVVYLAEQVEPVRRQVAVKIIKLGMDTREVIARFEAERQALALMDHPGIATVLDAGATEAGRPYFVMELVRGESITSYCDRHNLELSARLALFRQVCQAVQHAHQKGIIHRDLKPSNVLVTLQDNNPVPKVIDFGIAKATHQRLTERTMFTEHRQLIGTPEYMSPEQAEMTGLDIDTRSDIYSLGVLLYELLTGVTPFDSRKLRSAAYGEIQRIIREETPAKPSTRLSSVDSLPSIAAHRQTEPRRLGLMVRGDLDWIVMKALEKDRTRRYDTASAFAADIERYLENEPVEASPPSAVYRVRKFVKRHRGRVIAASLVVAVFLLGSVGTAGGLIWALNENERANDAATRAEAKEESARHMLDFFVDLFDEASPQRTGGKPMTVLEFLDVGADGIDGLADQPEIQAKMKETIGLLYVVLSEFNKADPLLHEAVDYREADQAGDPASLASSLSALAALYQWTGREEQGLTLAERAVAIWERELGDSTELAESLTVMGNCLQRTGRMDEAIVAHERALAVREAVLPPGDAARSISLHNIGICYFFKNDSPAAETYFKRAIDTYEAAGRRTHGLATSQHVLSIVYFFQKKLQLAEQYQRQAYATRVEVLPAGHDHIALSLITLGNICRDLRRYEESETLLREGLAIHEPKLGSDHGEVWWDKKSLIKTLIKREAFADAASLQAELARSIGPDGDLYDRAACVNLRGDLLLAQDRLEESHAAYTSVVANYDDPAVELDQHGAAASFKLAIVRARLGRPDHAAPAETALAYLLEEWGATDPDLIRLRTEYADALFASGAIEAAQPIYALVRAAHASVTAESAADPFRVDAAGRFLLTCRDVSQRSAETALAHAQRVNRDVPDDPHYLATLARALMATGSSAEAVVTQRRACELLPEASGWRLAFESDLRAYGDGRLDDGWGSGG